MPLDWKEIAHRARTFSKDWKHVEREDADAKSFWDEFFAVFGIKRRKVATFEKNVKKIDKKDGYIDLLWKGTLLIEHKSRGKDLVTETVCAGVLDYVAGWYVKAARYITTAPVALLEAHRALDAAVDAAYALNAIRSQFPTLNMRNV